MLRPLSGSTAYEGTCGHRYKIKLFMLYRDIYEGVKIYLNNSQCLEPNKLTSFINPSGLEASTFYFAQIY